MLQLCNAQVFRNWITLVGLSDQSEILQVFQQCYYFKFKKMCYCESIHIGHYEYRTYNLSLWKFHGKLWIHNLQFERMQVFPSQYPGEVRFTIPGKYHNGKSMLSGWELFYPRFMASQSKWMKLGFAMVQTLMIHWSGDFMMEMAVAHHKYYWWCLSSIPNRWKSLRNNIWLTTNFQWTHSFM